MTRGNALRYPDSRESTSSARARLAMLLTNATDKAFAGFTAEGLAQTHRLSVNYARQALEVAQQVRGRRR